MKTILLAGCYGEIGKNIYSSLKEKYKWILCDNVENDLNFPDYFKIDFTNYNAVSSLFSKIHVDVVVSLIGIKESPNIPEYQLFDQMVHTYLYTTYNILKVMQINGINTFIFASSNHVTDAYEENGYSLLGREINIADYPKSKSVYGSLKLASESLCNNFKLNYGINTYIFRIGTYRSNFDINTAPDRWKRTLIKEEDIINAFLSAIENKGNSDIYYLVSNNQNKPWNNTEMNDLLE